MGVVVVSVAMVALTLVVTVALVFLVDAIPWPTPPTASWPAPVTNRPARTRPARTNSPAGTSSPARRTGAADRPARMPLRLASRLIFATRSTNAITVDCLLVRVDDAGTGTGTGAPTDTDTAGRPSPAPRQADTPSGLPFTLQLRPPEMPWFADRVEELLSEWASDARELVVELREDHGRVRTTIASGDSSVYLELASAAGLATAPERPRP